MRSARPKNDLHTLGQTSDRGLKKYRDGNRDGIRDRDRDRGNRDDRDRDPGSAQRLKTVLVTQIHVILRPLFLPGICFDPTIIWHQTLFKIRWHTCGCRETVL